jgi:hypothetical protein
LLAAAILGYTWWSGRAAPELSVYLPREAGSIVSADFARLRALGLIGGKQWNFESEYAEFVAATGFDFERDLDHVLLYLNPAQNIYLASGRFAWEKLRRYALQQNGKCVDRACSVPSSQAGKFLSFYPLGQNAIALALATDPYAAANVRPEREPRPPRCIAELDLRGEDVRRWLPLLGEVKAATACAGDDARMKVEVSLVNEAAARAAEEGFRTLAQKLDAAAVQRNGVTFALDWQLRRETLSSWFAGMD